MRVSSFFATAIWLAFASAAAIKEIPAENAGATNELAKRGTGEKPHFPEPKYFRITVMPWDLDADVQVTEADMYFLAAYHNMTIYYYKYGDMKKGRFFQLEINPYFKYREQDDVLNVIDARWIDLETGLFIDITAARYNPSHEQGEGILYDKHGHEYRDTYLFPLRDTTFEGVPAKIPYRYKEMLASEYGQKALSNTKYHSFTHARFEAPASQLLRMATGKSPHSSKPSPVFLTQPTGRERRAERLNERLRGAQRANVEDDSFHLDIAGLNIAGSDPAPPPVSSARRTPNTSAKRKRLDHDELPPSKDPSNSGRRSIRSGPKDPYDLPDTSKESVAQPVALEDTPQNGEQEQEQSVPGDEEEPEAQPSSPTESPALPQMDLDEQEDTLESLPEPVHYRSPALRRISRNSVEEIEESPQDAPGSGKRRSVRMSDALSSSTRLHDAMSTDGAGPPSSSPLARKVRRSDAAASVRSAGSFRQRSRLMESEDMDELSPTRAAGQGSDEFSGSAAAEEEQVLGEEEFAEATQVDEEPVADDEATEEEPEEEPEQEFEEEPEPEAEAEEAPEAEEIDETEAAKTLGRKRPRRSLPPQSPELGSGVFEEAEEEPVPKRRRGRVANSPATQKQPAPKPKPKPKVKPQPQRTSPRSKAKPAPKPKTTRKPARESGEGGDATIAVTVQRFVNVKNQAEGEDAEDPLQSEVPFATHGETAVDVFSQVCMEVIKSTLGQLEEAIGATEDKAKKKEYRIKMRAIEAYREELKSRLLQHAIHLNDWHSLRKRVRLAQREKITLRDEIIRLKGEREQVALRMDAVRIKHEEDTKETKHYMGTSTTMHDVDLAIDRGRDAPELSRAEQKQAELANLELLVPQISDQVSSASATGGMLQQVMDFNAFLERAAVALESR
ncbi:hypothetical protein G7Z17_g6240 [Cylindrodendrum hubeiense]|uniref:Uncharacterized protein n=1 Tax=Cylindrodendrum hubeiense TaxID=595255 RepID=A0A9P5LB13_9HYPO|nr:hypothetical protein G7Z17_g6240 [Cylindrodendrum hubeiense]